VQIASEVIMRRQTDRIGLPIVKCRTFLSGPVQLGATGNASLAFSQVDIWPRRATFNAAQILHGMGFLHEQNKENNLGTRRNIGVTKSIATSAVS
jgi:hypothetical protein